MEDLSGLEDLKLVQLVMNGNDRAFATIVSRYERQIARTIKGMLGETDLAEDVGQETFIRFYRSIKKYRGDAALGTYLTRIAINLSLNELNKQKRTLSLFFKRDQDEVMFDIPEPTDKFEETEVKEMVDKALQQLDPGFRSVIVLRLLEGYSTKETAEILELPLGTVLSRLSRAQKSLAKILKPLMH